jgi:hypothetical protein
VATTLPPHGTHHVGDFPRQGIGREPRKTVAAAALHPDGHVGKGKFRPGPWRRLRQAVEESIKEAPVVLRLLEGEKPDLPEVREPGLHEDPPEILAPEPRHDDARRAGISREALQDRSGPVKVVAELRTPVGVGENPDPFYP